MKPLYNHNSLDTSFEVLSYPYGSLRCKINFWMEKNDKKGWRFCHRTISPKNGRENAPKKSTYSLLAGNMYLDENEHCHWAGLNIYDSAEEVAQFISRFPGSDFTKLRPWVQAKIIYTKKCAEGKIVWKVGNVEKPPTEFELEEHKKELAQWEAAKALLPVIETPITQ